MARGNAEDGELAVLLKKAESTLTATATMTRKPRRPCLSVCGASGSGEIVEEGAIMIVEKKCGVCGKAYKPMRKTQKYCSLECQHAAGLARKREKYGPTFLSLPESERTYQCLVCGKSFIAKQPQQKYCSKSCANRSTCAIPRELYNRSRSRYKSHIEEINARARAQGKSYGQLQAEKRLAALHVSMTGGKDGQV